MLDKDEKKFEHPSYAMVGFSRGHIGGSGRILFGSSVKTNHVISLRITRAERRHHLNQDWYFGGRQELIEVDLTESQFVDLITQLNQGDGVPCTLTYYNGEIVKPEEHPQPSEAQLVHQEFKGKAKAVAEKLKASVQAIKDIANNSKMTQKDKKSIADAADAFANEAQSHMPFLLSQLDEAADRLVTQAKTEVMAFTERTLRAAGLEHKRTDAPMMIDVKEEK